MPFSSLHPANALLPGYHLDDYSQVLYRWNYINTGGALGTAAQVSFSFMTQRPAYYVGTNDFLSFQTLTTVQMDGARAALAAWAEVANLTFTEVADNANGGLGGQIRFGRGDTAGGYAFYPSSSQKGGDVEISNSATYLNDFTPGSPGYSLMLHEIGHALGLSHSFGDTPNLTDFGIPDSVQYSLMSYTPVDRPYIAYYTQNGGSYSYGYWGYLEPETPMVYDIAAMQILYGANTTTRTGDDIYSYDLNPVMLRTIWDAGGNDTLDLSNQHRANIVDLTPGSYSSIGYLADPLADWPSNIAASFKSAYPSLQGQIYNGGNNLGIAFDTVIENVIGGSGDDQITGNAADNILRGNAGNDIVAGWDGADTLYGGSGNDNLFGVDGNDTLYGESGIDYLVGGSGDDTLDGGDNPDAIYGEDGNDTLYGGIGFHTDIMVGGAGDDILNGSGPTIHYQGDYDLMDGGSGNDTYYVDTPNDLTFEAAGGGTDTVIAEIDGGGYYLWAYTENLTLAGSTPFGVGNELDNILTGSSLVNWLLGGAGNDTINGKGGNDVLFGEAGIDTFVFERGTGGDVVGDFLCGTDQVQIAGLGFSSFAQVQAAMSTDGVSTALDLGMGDFVVFNGVTMASFAAGDFLL
ncbi:MAG: matrixin family metalloprotease [Thiobacillus sp.]|nr:matrixin family metalloprotease [Thiobacillus sp.]